MAIPRIEQDDSDLQEMLRPSTMWDKVIGRDENKRSTKTNIPDMNLAAGLSVLRNHAQRLDNLLRRMHNKRFADLIADGDEIELHPGKAHVRYGSITSFEGLHQHIVEHLASHKGFSLKTMMGLARLEEEYEHRQRTPGDPDGPEYKTDKRRPKWQ